MEPINIKSLSKAIQAYTSIPVNVEGENRITLDGVKLDFSGNICRSSKLTVRIKYLKQLLLDLREAEVLRASNETISKILDRYQHLNIQYSNDHR